MILIPSDNDIMREFTSGLATNTKSTSLNLFWERLGLAVLADDYLLKILCDPTSIESIYSSNHTLEDVRVDYTYPIFHEELLELNKDKDKAQVVRNKILKYYFVGDFDVTPFTNLPLSILPEVTSQIRSDTKQSSIFRLLKSIPELSNASSGNLTTDRS
jgi:hypothetical protein